MLGARGDSARVLTLLHRPTRFQLALPLADGTRSEVLAALRGLSAPLGGPAGARRVFGPALGGALPIRLFRAALGEDAEALLAALGVREVPYGELLMSPAAVGRAGGRGAGPGHRAGTQPRPARGPVALAPEPGAAGGRSAPPGPARRRGHDPSTSENGGGRDLRRPSRRRAGCGNPDSGQTVSLTLLINLK